jgi:hypothetical protein
MSILAIATQQQQQHQQHCCHAFLQVVLPTPNHQKLRLASAATDDQDTAMSSSKSTNKQLDKTTAQQFTIQVCTSTSCCKKLNQLGLDQYHLLGELYEEARIANIEQDIIVEDGGCRGGMNCKMGPCVAVLHEDFDGSVALEGMAQSEFNERVFHGVSTQDDVNRVWSCVTNAINLMADEASES